MFTTNEMVDRRAYIANIEKTLQVALDGQDYYKVVEFYGVAGLGKSRILSCVKSACRSRQLTFAAIDLMYLEGTELESQQLSILQQVCDQLEHRLPDLTIAQQSVAAAKRNALLGNPQRADDASRQGMALMSNRVPMDYVLNIARALDRAPLILILDSTETCSRPLFEWLGNEVIREFRCAGVRSVIVFLAGRGQRMGIESTAPWPQLKPLEIESYLLESFELPDSVEHVNLLSKGTGFVPPSEAIHGLSNGHPLSNERIMEWLKQQGVADVEFSVAQLANSLNEQVVEEYILSRPDVVIKQLIELACITRAFDTGLLQNLAIQFQSTHLAKLDLERFRIYLIGLSEAPLNAVFLYKRSFPFELEPTLRRLVHTIVTSLHPTTARKQHEYVRKLFLDNVENFSTREPLPADQALEILYHTAWIARLGNESVRDCVIGELGHLLQDHYHLRNRSHFAILQSLEELVRRDRELCLLIGEPETQDVLSVLAQTTRPEKLRTAETQHISHFSIDFSRPSDYETRWYMPSGGLITSETVSSGQVFALDDWRRNPEGIGKLAFRLYLPRRAQENLRKSHDWHIQLATDAPHVPWELLHNGTDFLCLKYPIARRAALLREPKSVPPLTDPVLKALVVGNPTDNLAGAAHEAKLVATILEDYGFEVELYIGSADISAAEFSSRLVTGSYDLVHFAGHAYFDQQDPQRSGLLFRDGPVLAEELERLIESNAFFFINACESAATKVEEITVGMRGNMVEGIAIAVLQGGCCACLGPMWPIGDQDGIAFATAFYEYLLAESTTFSDATYKARRQMYKDNMIGWTPWALYGDVTAKFRYIEPAD